MNKKKIINYFKPILNEHSWNVQKGYGSFLTLEFGNPRIEYSEPENWKHLNIPLKEHKKRNVIIKGTHQLWIYCCNWQIKANGQNIAFDESTDEKIWNAVNYLNGQKLNEVIIDLKKQITIFKFDLGGEITTFNEAYNHGSEMWMLYMPKEVLTLNNMGKFNICKLNDEQNNLELETIESDIIKITHST